MPVFKITIPNDTWVKLPEFGNEARCWPHSNIQLNAVTKGYPAPLRSDPGIGRLATGRFSLDFTTVDWYARTLAGPTEVYFIE